AIFDQRLQRIRSGPLFHSQRDIVYGSSMVAAGLVRGLAAQDRQCITLDSADRAGMLSAGDGRRAARMLPVEMGVLRFLGRRRRRVLLDRGAGIRWPVLSRPYCQADRLLVLRAAVFHARRLLV